VAMNLFVRPVQLLIDAVKVAARSLLNIGKPKATPPPRKGPGGKPRPRGLGLVGGLFASFEAFMNFKNGENVDAIMNAALLLPAPPIVKGLLLLGVTADNIAEAFRGNIFGKHPRYAKKAKEIEDEAKKQKKPPTSGSTQAKSTPMSQPQNSLMGNNKEELVEPNTAPGTIPGAESLKKNDKGQSAAGVTPQTSMTPAAGDLSLGSGMQESLSQGQASGMTENTSFQVDSGSMSMSAQISPLPSDPAATAQNVGPLPEVKPTIIPLPMPGQQQSQLGSPTGTSGVSQNVPSFDPENPNNPYVMYSHSVYNVAMV